ncbi:alcohol oxidase [Meredithblackwellia eburnea MCA 4105]
MEPWLVEYLGPLVLLLLGAYSIRYAFTLVKGLLPPPWYIKGIPHSEFGDPIDEKEQHGLGISELKSDDTHTYRTFDYVILGGGTTGSVLASRLTENPTVSVLVLEAGESDSLQIFSRIPFAFARLFATPAEWGLWTEGGVDGKAPGVKGRSLRWPRGRMLGGCSSINAMICHHSSPSDFDEIAALGNPGWAYKDLLPYFAKSQKLVKSPDWPNSAPADASETRGTNGPLHVGYSWIGPLSSAFIKACGAVGIPIRDDVNVGGTLGVSRGQTFIKNGSRVSASNSYLTADVASRPNLTIATGANVTKITMSKEPGSGKFRATGAEFVTARIPFPGVKPGQPVYRVLAKREVIVAAGSLSSPQILKVSGIGPREELEAVGVPVIIDLPGVGENLKDHTAVGLVYKTKPGWSVQYLDHPIKGLPALAEWLRHKTGPLTSNVAEAIAFCRSTDPALAKVTGIPPADVPDHGSLGVGPDVEFLESGCAFKEHGKVKPVIGTEFFTIGAIHLRPQSKGRVKIVSPSTLVKPIIEANLIEHEDDIKTMVWGLKVAQKIANSEPLASMLDGGYEGPKFPKFPDLKTHSEKELEDYVREQSETMYHPIGTVKMAPLDQGGCVDPSLRVYGVEGLRVCDGSIFPEQISGHPMAPLCAIAEKFAENLLREVTSG